jgi:hypothetical protein
MTDTQAAMREFRFLDEKRKTNGLSPYEEQRWQGLASFLGIDLFTEAQSWGQWGADGQWYPYPGYEGYYPPEQAYGQNYAHYQTQDYPQEAYGDQGLVPQYDEAGQFVGNYPLAPAEAYSAEGYAAPGYAPEGYVDERQTAPVQADASYAQPWVPPYPPGVDTLAPADVNPASGWPQPPSGDWPAGGSDFNFNSRPSSLDKSGDPVGDLRRALSLETSQSVTVPVEALTPEHELPTRPKALFSNLVPWREADVPSSAPVPAPTPSINPTTPAPSLLAPVSALAQAPSPSVPTQPEVPSVATSPSVWPKLEPLTPSDQASEPTAIDEGLSPTLETGDLATSFVPQAEGSTPPHTQTGEVEMVSDAFVEEVELSTEHQIPEPSTPVVSAAPELPVTTTQIQAPHVEPIPLQLTQAIERTPSVVITLPSERQPTAPAPEPLVESVAEGDRVGDAPTTSLTNDTPEVQADSAPAQPDFAVTAELRAPSIEGESTFDVDVESDGDESPAAAVSEPTVFVEMQSLPTDSVPAPTPDGSLLDSLVSIAEMSQGEPPFEATPAELSLADEPQTEDSPDVSPPAVSLQPPFSGVEEVPEPLASVDFVAENDVLAVPDDAPEASAPTTEEALQVMPAARSPSPFVVPPTSEAPVPDALSAASLEEDIDVSFDAPPSAPEPVSIRSSVPLQTPQGAAPIQQSGESLPMVEVTVSAVVKAPPSTPEVLAVPVHIDAPVLRAEPYASSNTGLFAQMPPLAPSLTSIDDAPLLATPALAPEPVLSVSAVASKVNALAQHESEIIEGVVLDDEPAASPVVIAAPAQVAAPIPVPVAVPAPLPLAQPALAADSLDDLWPQDAPTSAPRAPVVPAPAPLAPTPRKPAQPAVPPTLSTAAVAQKPVPNPVPQHVPQTVPEFFDRSGGHLRDSVISVPLPGEHRVILHTLEGQVKRGTLRNADLGDDTLELLAAASSERIARPRVKAIFFLLPAGGRLQPSKGAKVRVTFKDGRQVAGFSNDHKGMGPGFFVVPADNRTNTERIYIYRHGISGVITE